jgi:hypothetical protein
MNLDGPLEVTLSSSDRTEARVPATVTIPAGSASATFPISAVNDSEPDGVQSVTITAAAPDWVSGQATVTVFDNEARLSLSVNPATFLESAGPNAATATLTRNTPTTEALEVALTSRDTTEARVPATITIPAGASSMTFPVEAVNDTSADGARRFALVATAQGYPAAVAYVTVEDNDVPTLRLRLSRTTVLENAGANAAYLTVSRNSVGSAVVVTLASSELRAATVPTTVTIPVGTSSVTVPVAAVDDDLVDGAQVAVFRATATGHIHSETALTVTDNDNEYRSPSR